MLVKVFAASIVDGFEKPIGSSAYECECDERSSRTSDEELRSKVCVS